MATLSLEVNKQEAKVIEAYAKIKHRDVSELLTESLFHEIEEELDIDEKLHDDIMHPCNFDEQAIFCNEMFKRLDLIDYNTT